jgi:hypothetical protein
MRQCPAGVRAGQRRNRAGKSGGTHASTTPSGPRPARRPPTRAEAGGCAAIAYPADCSKRAFEVPMPKYIFIQPRKRKL